MTENPYVQIVTLFQTLAQRNDSPLTEGILLDAGTQRFSIEGEPVQAAGHAADISLTPQEEGQRYLCYAGKTGVYALCRLSDS